VGGADRQGVLLREAGMPQNVKSRAWEIVFVYGAQLLSNLTAFITPLWLIPSLIASHTIAWLLLGVIAIGLLKNADLVSAFFKLLRQSWLFFPFAVFSGISIFWSIEWEISLFRWLTFVLTILVGGYIGLRYRLQAWISLQAGFGVFILLLSALLIVQLPDFGVMDYHSIQGAWRGVYWHKNHFGLAASFINLLFLFKWVTGFKSRDQQAFLWFFAYGLTFLFIYQSDSVAAYLTTILMQGLVAAAWLWLRFRERIRAKHLILLGAVLVVVGIVLFTHLDSFFGVFNRNTTLTGRIPMWTNMYRLYFNTRPVLGYGFNAFWYPVGHRETLAQTSGYPDPIVISDNGFVDILVNTGFIGLGLFLIFYFGLWWRSIQCAIKAEDIYGFFPVIFMVYTLIANISWSLIFENENFFMLIMVTNLFLASKTVENRIQSI
jgi:exopolysaccharide production protein ExoQ